MGNLRSFGFGRARTPGLYKIIHQGPPALKPISAYVKTQEPSAKARGLWARLKAACRSLRSWWAVLGQ